VAVVRKKRPSAVVPDLADSDLADWPEYRWVVERYGADKPVRKALQKKYRAIMPEFFQLLQEIVRKHPRQGVIAFLQLIAEPWKVSSKLPEGPKSAELLRRIRLKDDSVARFIELGRKIISLENLLSAETTPEEREERSNKIASILVSSGMPFELVQLFAGKPIRTRGRPATKRAAVLTAFEHALLHPRDNLQKLTNYYCNCGRQKGQHPPECANSLRVQMAHLERDLKAYGLSYRLSRKGKSRVATSQDVRK
jgi:hypothetical protein